MKQTAVEWLDEQIKEYDFSPRDNTYLIEIPFWIWKEKIEQAKAMEKEQIVKAYESLEFDVSSNEVVCPLCDGRDEYIKTETGYECAFTDCMHKWAK